MVSMRIAHVQRSFSMSRLVRIWISACVIFPRAVLGQIEGNQSPRSVLDQVRNQQTQYKKYEGKVLCELRNGGSAWPEAFSAHRTLLATVYRDGEKFATKSTQFDGWTEDAGGLKSTQDNHVVWDMQHIWNVQQSQTTDMPAMASTATGARKDPTRQELNYFDNGGELLFGVMNQDSFPAAEILRESNDLRLGAVIDIGGITCVPLMGTTPYGFYTLWVDQKNPALVRKMAVKKGPDDIGWRDQKLGEQGSPIDAMTSEIDGMVFRTIEGIQVPVGGVVLTRTHFADGKLHENEKKIEFDYIDLSPDLGHLNPFEAQIPEGAMVLDIDMPDVQYEWRSGIVVPHISEDMLDDITKAIDETLTTVVPVASRRPLVIRSADSNSAVFPADETEEQSILTNAPPLGALLGVGGLLVGVLLANRMRKRRR